MASRGGRNVRQNASKVIADIRERVTKKVMTEITITGEANAMSMTPVDTSNLANSRYRNIHKSDTGYEGRVGFTAKYAGAVHDAEGKLKGQQRPPKNGRSRGAYWSPDGEPEFLRKGFEDPEAIEDFRDIIRREYRR
ncbi:hypothetical protein [Carnimonas bestiolae]|uniref:hypothetical protein n=1 Tax=Carnimonas bestiolae TaxID=3402172 RepID=UPI003F4AB3ED